MSDFSDEQGEVYDPPFNPLGWYKNHPNGIPPLAPRKPDYSKMDPVDYLMEHSYETKEEALDHGLEVGEALSEMSRKNLKLWKQWAAYHDLPISDREFFYHWHYTFY